MTLALCRNIAASPGIDFKSSAFLNTSMFSDVNDLELNKFHFETASNGGKAHSRTTKCTIVDVRGGGQ